MFYLESKFYLDIFSYVFRSFCMFWIVGICFWFMVEKIVVFLICKDKCRLFDFIRIFVKGIIFLVDDLRYVLIIDFIKIFVCMLVYCE